MASGDRGRYELTFNVICERSGGFRTYTSWIDFGEDGDGAEAS